MSAADAGDVDSASIERLGVVVPLTTLGGVGGFPMTLRGSLSETTVAYWAVSSVG